MADSLAILPPSLGKDGKPPGSDFKPSKASFIPGEKGGLLLKDPNEAPCPYTFTDSPAYLRAKEAEERAKRANELEGKEETRGFLRNVEELGKKQKWDEVSQLLERRTNVPSGLFLVTRAVLRWKFGRYGDALRDVEQCLREYGSSVKAGPLAGAFACFARICLGSAARHKEHCSKDMRLRIAAWEDAELRSNQKGSAAQADFRPKQVQKLTSPTEVVDGMRAHDGSYHAGNGVKIGYVLLQNLKDAHAPFILHFHGAEECAADYRSPEVAARYLDLNVHLLVVDYRGYGWSTSEPSIGTFLCDAEVLAESLQETFLEHSLPWPYTGGLIVSGRSMGAQVAIHLATIYPTLFRALLLDSPLATTVAGDRLGKGAERTEALECWNKELTAANLEVLQPLNADIFRMSAMEKIKGFDGQLLILHGKDDELAPVEASESLHKAASSKTKELVLVEGKSHNHIVQSPDYWSAQKRFTLRVTLDDVVPSIGPVVHLCAVCHEKAVAKCGRCEKVWYCGRKHQAEHWKEHKALCVGAAPEPQPKPKAEGEACMVAALAVNLTTEDTLEDLCSLITSLLDQEEPFHSIYVAWHAEGDLGDATEVRLAGLRHKGQIPIVAVEAESSQSCFEHLRALGLKIALEAPKHSWISLGTGRELFSPVYVARILPELRKAAVDAKVVAACCARAASPKAAATSLERLSKAAVDSAIESGTLGIEDVAEHDRDVGSFVVKLQALQAFFKSTPAAVLPHRLCAKLFLHRLMNSFGKKVVNIDIAPNEWMRFVEKQAEDVAVTEDDRARGLVLHDGVKAAEKFDSVEQAVLEVSKLRKAVEQRVVLMAGQTVSSKDLRDIGRDEVTELLAKNGLDNVIGLHGWARQTASDLIEAAVEQFGVKLEA